jgi:pimeloyl-ACP methyl ester carboxylesterase
MTDVSGFPYFEVQFDEHGQIEVPAQADALKKHIRTGPTAAELIVFAHGWNNDEEDARQLYRGLLSAVRAELTAARVEGIPADLAVLAVLWPSKKFADTEVVASPAAGLASAISDAALVEQIDNLREATTSLESRAKLDTAKVLIPDLEDSPKAQAKFADLIRSVLPSPQKGLTEEDTSQKFFSLDGGDLMDRLAKPVPLDVPQREGAELEGNTDGLGEQGGAAGLGNFFTGVRSAARNLLNYSTYYLMKERAGTVGDGVNALLRQLRDIRTDLKIHLVGHSFGARLVTTAARGSDSDTGLTIHTIVLLQAAFSHNAFAVNFDDEEEGRTGDFRRVVAGKLVRGPALISHTVNDRAVGLAYPIASRIAGDDAAWLGDKDSRFGGLGRNGAQHTPEASARSLLAVQDKYEFEGGKVYNLQADRFIGHHGDIVNPEVAHAIVSAITAAR